MREGVFRQVRGLAAEALAPLQTQKEGSKRRFPNRLRLPLAVKFTGAFVGLVTLALFFNGAAQVWLSYGEAKRTAIRTGNARNGLATLLCRQDDHFRLHWRA